MLDGPEPSQDELRAVVDLNREMLGKYKLHSSIEPRGGNPGSPDEPSSDFYSFKQIITLKPVGKKGARSNQPFLAISESQEPEIIERTLEKWALRATDCQCAPEGEWELVRQGPSDPTCGTEFITYVCRSPGCPSSGVEQRIPITCRDRKCPTCGEKWAEKTAALAAHRMLTAGRSTLGRGTWGRHAIVSPPRILSKYFNNNMGVAYGKMLAAMLAMLMGFRGCSVVFHSKRDSFERGHYDVDGPHFHITGWADKLLQGDELPRVFEGWIFKGICSGDGSAFRLESWADFYNVLSYELGHAAIVTGRQTITYYGICHYSKVKMTRDERLLRSLPPGTICRSCGRPLSRVSCVKPSETRARTRKRKPGGDQLDLLGETLPEIKSKAFRPITHVRSLRT